ncbi:MAG TPA: lytic transglycosylase domain-containing protein [bacterium]|nr:lytic transglycosylase domain-containing protein [bacterium]
MARQRYHQPQPVWRNILLPIVQWVSLAGIFVAVAILIAGEVRPPSIVTNQDQDAQVSENGPFSLSALYQRLPPEAINRVNKNINYFLGSARRRIVDGLARSTKYMEPYQQIFREEGLPEELAYLPLIESGFVEKAVSPAKAVGIWQFIEETGRRYDLHHNDWSDKRLDPIYSARAAARLLKHLHATFHDWELALAAYNAGAGTVKWAIRVNRKAGLPTNFWALDLPEETENYVPTFLATVMIAKNPGAFGITSIRYQPQMAFDHIKVSPGLSLEELADESGIPEKVLEDLNPALIRGTVPPGDQPYLLRVPRGARYTLPAKLAGVTHWPRDWVLHRVHFSDTVEDLAARYRGKPAKILQANDLDNDQQLLLRNYIIIPL